MARLRAEYPAALERLERAYSRVRASGVVGGTLESVESGRGGEVEVVVVDGMRKAALRTKRADPTGGFTPRFENVYCVGRDVAFRAKRDLVEGGPHVLSDVSGGTAEGRADDTSGVSMGFNEIAGKYLFAPFKMHGWSDRDLLDEGRYVIKSADEVVLDGEKVLRFEYVSKPSDPGSRPTTGRVEVLPDRAWVVRRHEINAVARAASKPDSRGDAYTMVLDVAYAGDRDGMPVPRLVRYSGSIGEGVFRFDEVEFGASAPEREFTPNHYRLPDVTKPARDPSRSNAVYWIFGGAALALIAAVVVKKRFS